MREQMPQQIFDPHVHFIDLQQGHYHWLRKAGDTWLNNINQIKRNFTDIDLQLSPPFELKNITHIEAGFDNANPERELAFVSSLMKQASMISYLALDSEPEYFERKLSLFMLFEKFVGIRDISEGSDYQRLLSGNVITNLALLAEHNLLFEAQFNLDNSRAVELVKRFAAKLPQQQIVLNHCGFPKSDSFNAWTEGVKLLSNHQNIAVKFCGFEMLNKPVTIAFKQQVLDVLIDGFSENRVMFASNFPLCLTQKSYHEVWEEYSNMKFTPGAWSKLSCINAKRIYSLK